MNHTYSLVLAVVFLLPGIAGVFLPFLPGLLYMFIVAAGFGIYDKFAHLTIGELAILGLVAITSLAVDYLAGVLGAKYGGASRRAILFGFMGFVFGLFLFPPFGSVVGMFVGVLIAELQQSRNHEQAIKAATGSVLGMAAGIGINLVLAIGFIILFVLFSLR